MSAERGITGISKGGKNRIRSRPSKPWLPISYLTCDMREVNHVLRHVHHHPARTVAELAKTLGRDYKRVHDDVSALAHAGLIVRDENGIRAPYDSVQAIVSLEA